jgi:hypothetical protein
MAYDNFMEILEIFDFDFGFILCCTNMKQLEVLSHTKVPSKLGECCRSKRGGKMQRLALSCWHIIQGKGDNAYVLHTSKIKAPLSAIPWRSRRLWSNGTMVQVRPLPNLQLPTRYICRAWVGCTRYTSVIWTSIPSSSVPKQRCATRNSQSIGMWILAKNMSSAIAESKNKSHLLLDSAFLVESCVEMKTVNVDVQHSRCWDVWYSDECDRKEVAQVSVCL